MDDSILIETNVNIKQCLTRNDFPYRLDEPPAAEPTGAAGDSASASVTLHPSPVSSSFRFIGDYADATQLLRRTPDFDSVILLLHEAQGCTLHRYRDGGGPGAITEGTRRHAMRRELEQRERRQHQAQLVHSTSAQITQQEHDRLLVDVQPPWSWMHQFAAANCRSKAYNFLECQSMASSGDRTPSSDSSDESFDFERGRFHAIESEATTAEEDDRQAMETMLLADEKTADGEESVEVGDDDDGVHKEDEHNEMMSLKIVDMNTLLDDLVAMLEEAVGRKQIELSDTHSVASFVLDNGLPGLNLAAVRVALRHADEQQLVFADFGEMRAYLQCELNWTDVDKTEQVPAVGSVSSTTCDLASDEAEQEESKSVPIASEAPSDDAEATVQVFEDNRPPLVDNFADCQLDEVTEEGVSAKPTGDPEKPMEILGLIGTPPPTPIVIPTPPQTPTPTPSTPHNTSSGIISANVSLDEFASPYAPVPDVPPAAVPAPEPFACEVSALPGIGAAVSVQTVRNFVTFVTGRAREELSGLAYPRHFREAACPHMVDTVEC